MGTLFSSVTSLAHIQKFIIMLKWHFTFPVLAIFVISHLTPSSAKIVKRQSDCNPAEKYRCSGFKGKRDFKCGRQCSLCRLCFLALIKPKECKKGGECENPATGKMDADICEFNCNKGKRCCKEWGLL